jgi:23S rRNA (adenine2503-C2)-methyltransferase
LLSACRDYTSISGRRITFEWALVKDVNDTPEQAHLLAQKVKGMLCHVNAIRLNPTYEYAGKATTRERAQVFKDILLQHGISCTVRVRRGVDIYAGCGQLSSVN